MVSPLDKARSSCPSSPALAGEQLPVFSEAFPTITELIIQRAEEEGKTTLHFRKESITAALQGLSSRTDPTEDTNNLAVEFVFPVMIP